VNSGRNKGMKVFPVRGLRYHRAFHTQVVRDAKFFNQ